jgi:phosphotransferase system HPr (HPr) family protein
MTHPAPNPRRRAEVAYPHGLHLRPADQLAAVARRFAAKVRVRFDGSEADGKSVLDLLCLAAGPGAVLELEAVGPDAEQAVEALADLLSSGAHGALARHSS